MRGAQPSASATSAAPAGIETKNATWWMRPRHRGFSDEGGRLIASMLSEGRLVRLRGALGAQRELALDAGPDLVGRDAGPLPELLRRARARHRPDPEPDDPAG